MIAKVVSLLLVALILATPAVARAAGRPKPGTPPRSERRVTAVLVRVLENESDTAARVGAWSMAFGRVGIALYALTAFVAVFGFTRVWQRAGRDGARRVAVAGPIVS